MTPQEKVIDRIKKLLAKANDEGTTQAEAASFAAKAAEIAAREAISLSDIEWKDRTKTVPIGAYHFWPEEHDMKRSKRRVRWMEDLCHAVCISQQCKMLLMGGNTFDIIGRGHNVEIAAYLCSYLCRFALSMSWRDYGVEYRKCQKEGDVTAARGFRDAWLTGFSRKVVERLRALQADLAKEFGSKSTALVRLTSELQEADDWMNQNFVVGKANALTVSNPKNREGYATGTSAGDHVDVTGRATHSGKTPGQLNS